MANRKAVGPDVLPAELLKLLTDEVQLNTLGNFHDIIVAVWRGGGVPQQWKDATILRCFTKRKVGLSVAIIAAHPS